MKNSWFEQREVCPVCASTRFSTIYESLFDQPPLKQYLSDFYTPQGMVEFDYLAGASYTLCECDQCKLIFQKFIPNDALLERIYDHWIDPDKEYEQDKQHHKLGYYTSLAQEIMQTIAYFDQTPASLSFFDFGMGWGRWAMLANALGCDTYGADIAGKRVAYAKSNGIKVVEWNDIPKHRFDFINTEQVFEHIVEPMDTLLHLKKSLKDGGIIKISVPYVRDIERRLKIMDWKSPKDAKDSLNPVAPLEHVNYYRRDSLIKMAKIAGMEIVTIPMLTQYRYSLDWGGAKNIAKNILYPFYRNVVHEQNFMFLRPIH